MVAKVGERRGERCGGNGNAVSLLVQTDQR